MYKKVDKNDVDYLLTFIPQERLLDARHDRWR